MSERSSIDSDNDATSAMALRRQRRHLFRSTKAAPESRTGRTMPGQRHSHFPLLEWRPDRRMTPKRRLSPPPAGVAVAQGQVCLQQCLSDPKTMSERRFDNPQRRETTPFPTTRHAPKWRPWSVSQASPPSLVVALRMKWRRSRRRWKGDIMPSFYAVRLVFILFGFSTVFVLKKKKNWCKGNRNKALVPIVIYFDLHYP